MSKKLTTTRLSEKGKITIPEKLRKELGLKEGDNFVVVGKDDTILLKLVKIPSDEKITELIAMAEPSDDVRGKEVSRKGRRKISVKAVE